MVQIDDVVVSLDVFREKFLCNLDACKGECCIEGDAGAPVELDEVEKLEEVLPVIWDELSPEARAVIDKQGVVYTDQDGDLVTSIVNGKDCVFTCRLLLLRNRESVSRRQMQFLQTGVMPSVSYQNRRLRTFQGCKLSQMGRMQGCCSAWKKRKPAGL